jgi:hypothetical protein
VILNLDVYGVELLLVLCGGELLGLCQGGVGLELTFPCCLIGC